MTGSTTPLSTVRLERSRETLAQARSPRFSTSLETNGVGNAAPSAKREQLKGAAEAFEAVFLRARALLGA